MVYRTLADHLGYDTEQVHEYCKRRFGLVTKFDINQGEYKPIHERENAYALNGDICDACGAECVSRNTDEGTECICTNEECEIEWFISEDGEMKIVYNPVDVIEITKSTKFFDTKEMTDYIDKIIRFAATELDIHIPEPGGLTEEQYVQAYDTKY